MSVAAEIGKGLADQWAQRVLAPASLFWLGGVACWSHGEGWQQLAGLWPSEAALQLALMLIALVIVAGSAVVMEALGPQFLRLAEGYWGPPFVWLRFWLKDRKLERAEKKRERWNELVEKEARKILSPRELDEKVQLDIARLQMPANTDYAMPTSIGNLLRAAETYPADRYGLDAVTCWPRLWLLLPEEDRKEFTTALAQLNQSATLWGWGVLFLVFLLFSWWSVPIAVLSVLFAWHLMRSRAAAFGDQLRAAFDLYRFDLYDQLQLTRPEHPETEPEHGGLLTRYLFRGETEGLGAFIRRSKSPDKSS